MLKHLLIGNQLKECWKVESSFEDLKACEEWIARHGVFCAVCQIDSKIVFDNIIPDACAGDYIIFEEREKGQPSIYSEKGFCNKFHIANREIFQSN